MSKMRPVQNYRINVDHDVHIIAAGHDPILLDLRPDRPDYVTTEGIEVWTERKLQKTRYLDAEGNQIGPVHKNLVPAIVWAIANGWRDPSKPDWWNDSLVEEVRENSKETK